MPGDNQVNHYRLSYYVIKISAEPRPAEMMRYSTPNQDNATDRINVTRIRVTGLTFLARSR
ncbi:hypothetical protein D3C76_1648360 [compost metagenome]